MVDSTYQPKVYRTSNGDKQVIASGGTLAAEPGSTVDLSGAALTLPAAQTLGAVTTIPVAGYINLDSETKTLTTNAVTTTKYSTVITTESLTTAHTASQALVITLVGVAAGDLAMVSKVGGTSTGGVPIFSAVCTTDTVTVTILNAAKATDAFNGTFIFNLMVFKA